MKRTIEPTRAGVRISASAAPDKQRALLDELARCASGTCSCPSPQYDKVQAMEVRAQPSGVTVELTVKPGEHIDVADIEKCLDHTAKQIGA
ncbi:hypothetical protein [Ideonella sp.]|uniref:hypothetical protein n=1 Tax=Ideonella sp. TaxID=1929293 RepID=UPI002B488408|nr:hypothetical protein [Ideonella sp.]HJV69134.1 hypothetical protein [Ideonella sp.]